MNSNICREVIITLNNILDVNKASTGMRYLRDVAVNIAHNLDYKYVLIGHAVKPKNNMVQTDVLLQDGVVQENVVYELSGTPCDDVFAGKRVCVHTDGLIDKFPDDLMLSEIGAVSYVGSAMLDSEKNLLGVLAVIDDKPIVDSPTISVIIEFLAGRIAAEIEREGIEQELKRKVVERTIELERANEELTAALKEIKSLQGIIPICANCKSIRDDSGYWQRVEAYLASHGDVTLTHGICPACMDELYGNEEWYKNMKSRN